MLFSVDHQLDFAFKHIADFLAGMDNSLAAAAGRDAMNVALQKVLARIGNEAFELNPFAGAQVVGHQKGPLARMGDDPVADVRRSIQFGNIGAERGGDPMQRTEGPVSYTHLRAHETDSY